MGWLYVWKGELWKPLIQLCSHKDKEAYMFKEAAGYGKGRMGKNLFFFPKQQVWAFDVFYLLDYTLSVGVFTLIKLVFEA